MHHAHGTGAVGRRNNSLDAIHTTELLATLMCSNPHPPSCSAACLHVWGRVRTKHARTRNAPNNKARPASRPRHGGQL